MSKHKEVLMTPDTDVQVSYIHKEIICGKGLAKSIKK